MRLIECDTCGTKIDVLHVALIIDGDLEHHFCNYKCLLLFMVNILNKEKENA
jgi:hypothetical protein